MAQRVRDATQRSERLLEGLLTLARSEREPSRREPADLADAATQALQHGRHADTAGLQVLTRLEPAPVAGDPALLDRMVANLIENTMRHNRPNGWSPPAPIAVGGRAGHQRRPRHPPTGSSRCSSRSAAWTTGSPHPPAAPAWACRSCARSPAPTTATPTPGRSRTAAWRSPRGSQPAPRPPWPSHHYRPRCPAHAEPRRSPGYQARELVGELKEQDASGSR
jgi:hypothetical protein